MPPVLFRHYPAMTSNPRPVRESLQQTGGDAWKIGGRLILSRHPPATPICTWNDAQGSVLHLSRAVDHHPLDAPSIQEDSFPLVYDVGDRHAVRKIGNAYLKVTIPESLLVTREHVVLDAVLNMKLEFDVPQVLYHGEWDGRYYLIVTAIPGQTLNEAWPQMDDTTKDQCVTQVTEICKRLATKEASSFGGADGNQFPEYYLSASSSEPDFDNETLASLSRAGYGKFYVCVLPL